MNASGRLLQYAMAHRQGWTKQQAADDLGYSMSSINQALMHVRRNLAVTTLNITSERPPGWGPQVFSLVDTALDTNTWDVDRTKDLRGRITTAHAVAQSGVNASDGRSVDGRTARLIEKALRRLLEDVEDLLLSA